jgi:uncharacterized protein (TIGR00156 family)
MKKAGFFVLLTVIFFSCDLGWEGGPPVFSIADAKNARDGTSVVLEGKVGTLAGNEKYHFSNGNDSILVEIDAEWWMMPNGLKEGDEVTIYGEVEKEYWDKTYIDVHRVAKKQENPAPGANGDPYPTPNNPNTSPAV